MKVIKAILATFFILFLAVGSLNAQVVVSRAGIPPGTTRADGSAHQDGDGLVWSASLGRWVAGAAAAAVVQIPYTSATPWTPTPAVGTAGSTVFFDCASVDHALAFGVPTGTPVNGQSLIITLISDASARALTWDSGAGGFQVVGVVLPVTTVASKVTTVGCKWNTTRGKWLVYAVSQEQ